MKREMRRALISIIVGVLLFFGGMWLGTRSAKQSTPKPAEPTQQVQVQAEKKPVEKVKQEVVKPAITALAAPIPETRKTVQPPAPTGWKASQNVGPASPMSAREEVWIDGLLYIWEAGGLHCPQVDYPTIWTPGRMARVDRPDGTYYFTWAPACYR